MGTDDRLRRALGDALELDERLLASLSDGLTETVLQPDETLPGAHPDGHGTLFVVIHGRVEFRMRHRDREVTVGTRDGGGTFGDLSSLVRGQEEVRVVATEPTRIIALDAAAVTRLTLLDARFAELNHAAVGRGLHLSAITSALVREFGDDHVEGADRLAAAATIVHLPAGRQLFAEGDPPDAAYVVISGRVVAHGGSGAGAASSVPMEPGELVGELGLLVDAPRARTVTAARDTVLGRVDRAAFDALTASHPATALELSRRLLVRIGAPSAPHRAGRTTIAVLGVTPGSSVERIVTAAVRSWPGPERVIALTSRLVDEALGAEGVAQRRHEDPASVRIRDWIHELEREHDIVLLECDEGLTGWTRRAVRDADVVAVVADRNDRSFVEGPTRMERELWELIGEMDAPPRTVLVIEHPPESSLPTGTPALLASRPADTHLHVRSGHDADTARLLRLLTGREIGVVFGGGGGKGFAHIGVQRAMHDLGIPIDVGYGASIGAAMLIGAATGVPVADRQAYYAELFDSLLDYTLPVVAVLKGKAITDTIDRACRGADLTDTWLPVAALSTNLTAASEQLHREGSFAHAIRASVSIPGVLPPVASDGELFIDGGTTNNLPADWLRRNHPTSRIIAIDVAPPRGPRAKAEFAPAQSGWARLGRSITPGMSSEPIPGLFATLVGATVVAASRDRARLAEAGIADLLVSLDLRDIGLLEFDRVHDAAERGYREALAPLAAWWATQPDGDPDAAITAKALLAELEG